MYEPPKLIKEHSSFGGKVSFYSHDSASCNSEMRFAVYQPPQAKSSAVPVLYFLSGLTCSEENFITKAGALQFAAKYGLMLVVPDTSPRNTGIPDEDKDWDLGSGAGFYVNATREPWKKYYQTYSYVVDELPNLMAAYFPIIQEKQSIFGHSMGGHGALICALKNPGKYKSISAFSPICAPTRCPWGEKAFSNYFGKDREIWRTYDATELVLALGSTRPFLIDIGTADPFLKQQQLLPELFESACEQLGVDLTVRMQEGYDHSYYFIATFMEDHIRYHAEALK